MLVTVFVPAYNRGYCIERTLDAILSMEVPEDWEVEYVWSDDNSTDNTWEIITRKAAEARKRGFNIVTSRNSKNLRLGKHVEKIMSLGHGEWFVECDSDDLPESSRLLELTRCMKQYPAMLGFSSGVTIKEADKVPCYSGVFGKWLFACGATCAWHRDLFAKFAPVSYETGSQDIFIPFRALLLGGQWVWSDTSTIIYGRDETNDSTPRGLNRVESLRHLARLKRNWISALSQRLADLEEKKTAIESDISELRERHERLIAQIQSDITRLDYITQYLDESFFEKLRLLGQCPVAMKKRKSDLVRLLLWLIPGGAAILSALSRLFHRNAVTPENNSAQPTGKTFAVDLRYLQEHPQEYLMML